MHPRGGHPAGEAPAGARAARATPTAAGPRPLSRTTALHRADCPPARRRAFAAARRRPPGAVDLIDQKRPPGDVLDTRTSPTPGTLADFVTRQSTSLERQRTTVVSTSPGVNSFFPRPARHLPNRLHYAAALSTLAQDKHLTPTRTILAPRFAPPYG